MRIKHLIVVGMSFLVLSCGDDAVAPTALTCNLSVSRDLSSGGPMWDVTYGAEKTGDGSLSKITYVDAQGTQTVSNPTLPWTKTVAVADGNTISITGTGTITNGSIEINLAGSWSDGKGGNGTSIGNKKCSQSTS